MDFIHTHAEFGRGPDSRYTGINHRVLRRRARKTTQRSSPRASSSPSNPISATTPSPATRPIAVDSPTPLSLGPNTRPPTLNPASSSAPSVTNNGSSTPRRGTQVLAAVTQIDRVTQANAAGAEETAAATVEMNNEVDVLHTGVRELGALLGLTLEAPGPSSPGAVSGRNPVASARPTPLARTAA